jgi:type IV fimbrial biogenesis protein FimT
MTLPELLTTMSIVAISLGMAASSYNSVVSNNRRATSINELVSTMHAARSEAITRNLQLTICPSSDGAACSDGADWAVGWMYFTDVDQNRVLDGTDLLLGQKPGTPRVSIASVEFPDFLVYRPNGRVMADTPDENTGQFTICDKRGPDDARVVLINSSGEPALSETQADGSAPECPDGLT